MDDKVIEHDRYNTRSQKEMQIAEEVVQLNGSAAVPYTLRTPYIFYEEQIRSCTGKGIKVLDVCCGNGLHSLTAAIQGADVTATDIAEYSLKLAAIRAERMNLQGMTFIISDAEELPFADNQFDVITCAGSLSYVDHEIFFRQVLRLLKPGGRFIAVDSFNHNPVYKLNRFIHYLRKNRSRSTLKRMPDKRTLEKIMLTFNHVEVHYFGIISFLTSIFKIFTSEERVKTIIDQFDKRYPCFKKYSFKIVIIAVK